MAKSIIDLGPKPILLPIHCFLRKPLNTGREVGGVQIGEFTLNLSLPRPSLQAKEMRGNVWYSPLLTCHSWGKAEMVDEWRFWRSAYPISVSRVFDGKASMVVFYKSVNVLRGSVSWHLLPVVSGLGMGFGKGKPTSSASLEDSSKKPPVTLNQARWKTA